MTKPMFERAASRVRFANDDMDFVFQWALGYTVIGGLDPGELFAIAAAIEDGDPESWSEAFAGFAARVEARATDHERCGRRRSAGEDYLKAFHAYRFAVQIMSPAKPAFVESIRAFQAAFARAVELLPLPIEVFDVAWGPGAMPGYFMRCPSDEPRPTVLVLGGGDNYREDLPFFLGSVGHTRGFHVAFVDLPAQGDTVPLRGLTPTKQLEAPIGAILDRLTTHAGVDPQRLHVAGFSGGGHMALRAATDPRVCACVANSPIIDMREVLDEQIPDALLSAPPVVLRLLLWMTGSFNAVGRVGIEKYEWQFSMPFREFIAHSRELKVDLEAIQCPVLCLVSEGEGEVLHRQAERTYAALRERFAATELRRFGRVEGAGAHCQLNNLRLLGQTVFDWLELIPRRDC